MLKYVRFLRKATEWIAWLILAIAAITPQLRFAGIALYMGLMASVMFQDSLLAPPKQDIDWVDVFDSTLVFFFAAGVVPLFVSTKEYALLFVANVAVGINLIPSLVRVRRHRYALSLETPSVYGAPVKA